MDQENSKKTQEWIREIVLILSNIAEIEERIEKIKNQALLLYKQLDDKVDGEDQG